MIFAFKPWIAGLSGICIAAWYGWELAGRAAFAQTQPPAVEQAQPSPPPAEPAPEAKDAPPGGGDQAAKNGEAGEARAGDPAGEAKPAEAAAPGPRPPVTLTVATWGGAYEQAQDIAFFQPYTKATADRIATTRHDGTLAALERQSGGAGKGWDVADLSSAVAEKACEAGLLEPLDAGLAGVDAAADFIPGALKPCAIGSVAWSAVMLFNTGQFSKKRPSTLQDVFDIKAFPGKRLFPEGPRYTLELALMADGVEPANVYATLATAEGQVRAMNALGQIKSSIVWWRDASEPVARTAAGEAAFGLGFNARAFHAIAADRQPLGLIWDGQIYDLDFWVVPKSAPNKEAAFDFIRFVTAPERLAEQARWLPYGPVRLSALDKVNRHAEVDIEMTPYLPTAAANFRRALKMDAAWWAANEAKIKPRFQAWLDGKPYGLAAFDADGNVPPPANAPAEAGPAEAKPEGRQ